MNDIRSNEGGGDECGHGYDCCNWTNEKEGKSFYGCCKLDKDEKNLNSSNSKPTEQTATTES